MNRSMMIAAALLLILIVGGIGAWWLMQPEPPSTGEQRGTRQVSEPTEYKVLYAESHALLIGMSDYTAGWNDLESIPGELDKLSQALQEQGFGVELDLNLTSDELIQKINQFIAQYGLAPDNRLLIYFSGHGHTRQEGEKGYFVPVDAPVPDDNNPTPFVSKAISMQQVITWAKEIESKHALFVFDSCFSGSIFKTRSNERPRVIDTITNKPARQIITAGSANESVPAQSVFTPMFIDAIKEGMGDMDGDGYVTGNELGLFLRNKVPEYSDQSPQFGAIQEYDYQGDFVFQVPGEHVAKTEPIEVKPPETPPLQPGEEMGYLQVVTNVDGKIFINDIDLGMVGPDQPFNYTDLEPGDSHIRIEAQGYETLEKTVAIESGKWTQESLVLTPVAPEIEQATLTVKSNVSDDSVYINNEFRGSSILDIQVAPGRYAVRVEKSGYLPYKTTVELTAGQKEVVTAELNAVPVTPKAKISTDKPEYTEGERIKITWKTQNARRVTINGKVVPDSGEREFAAVPGTQSYKLVAANAAGEEVSDMATVTVNKAPPRPRIDVFKTDKKRYTEGDNIQLTWATSHASKVTLNGKSVRAKNVVQREAKRSEQQYTLIAINAQGKAVRQRIAIEVVAKGIKPVITIDRPLIQKIDPKVIPR